MLFFSFGFVYQMPAWKGGYGEGTILKEAITVRDPRKEKPYRPKDYPGETFSKCQVIQNLLSYFIVSLILKSGVCQ